MMILRRPNLRASTETVPGPSSAIATSIVTQSRAENRPSNKTGGVNESGGKAAKTTNRAATAAAIGVQNPASSIKPLIATARLGSQTAVTGSELIK